MSKNNNFFNDLKKSLEEVLAHKQGKLDLRSYDIEVPEKQIKKIREKN